MIVHELRYAHIEMFESTPRLSTAEFVNVALMLGTDMASAFDSLTRSIN